MPKITKTKSRKGRSYLLYLGVDGGGTKTNVALMNEAKEVVAEGSDAQKAEAKKLLSEIRYTTRFAGTRRGR